jgi:hypothetical protein
LVEEVNQQIEDNQPQFFLSEDGHKRVAQSERTKWENARADLIHKDLELSHSAHIYHTELYGTVDKKLASLRKKMLTKDPFLMQRPHLERLELLKNCDLYKCFEKMPKPGVHHTHLTGAADINFLIELTYYDFVYYSETENMFWVSRIKANLPDGYVACSDLRQYWSGAKAFDQYLKDKMITDFK